MLIMNTPQFDTQDDDGNGNGISPISEWHMKQQPWMTTFSFCDLEFHSSVLNIFIRLRNTFRSAKDTPLSPIKVHDLTCFVLHRLLTAPNTTEPAGSPVSECIRYGIILYMLTVQGPIYYTHMPMLCGFVGQLRLQLTYSVISSLPRPLNLWLVAVGLVASLGTPYHSTFQGDARHLSASMCISTWQDLSKQIRKVLWLDMSCIESLFQDQWNIALEQSY